MKPLPRHPRLAFLAAVLVAGGAWAEEPALPPPTEQEEPPRNYANLRAGAATSSRLPALCLELAPLELLSIEACGPGSEFRSATPDPSLSHYRVWLKLASWKQKVGWLQPRVGLGFAEVQVGQDSGGFEFSGVGPMGVETAGPELSASLRLLLPVIGGFELVGELNANLAYFHYAPQLIAPQSRLKPSIGLTLGFGF